MSLSVKTLSAVKSNYIGIILRICAQFVAQIVIMRELGPELVGTFGYVLLLIGVLALIIDQGFGWSLIQSDFHANDEIAIVLSRIMFASLLGVIFMFAISYPIALLLDNELVGTVIRYSALTCFTTGLFIVPQARLRAELRFKEIQIAITGAYVIAYPIVGVAMAWGGFGVWSLLAAWYVQGIIQIGVAYHYSPHPLKLTNPFRHASCGSLGWRIAGINIVIWAIDGSASTFAGSFGAAALGNFNAALMLARTPVLHLVESLQTILFSTASAIGDDQSKQKRLYLSALAVIAFVIIPVYCYAGTHAELIINLLFGEKWLKAAEVFSALSIGMIALAISSLSNSILTATGEQKVVLNSQLVCLVVMITGLAFASRMNFIYVGYTVTVAYWLRLAMQLTSISAKVGISASEFISVLRGPILLGALMTIPNPSDFGTGLNAIPNFEALHINLETVLKTIPIFEAVHMNLEAVLKAIPRPHFAADDSSLLKAEILSLSFKCFVFLLLFKFFPRFFFSSSFVALLDRFAIGRRFIRALGL